MSRSQWKGNFIDKSLYKNFSKKKTDDRNQIVKPDNKKNLTQGLKVGTTKIGKKIDKTEMLIKVNSRRSTILKPFVGKEVWIYNGQSYIKRKITETMVGHKFGEFAYTRKRYVYKKKNTAVRGGRKG